jgi:hypothetical protein
MLSSFSSLAPPTPLTLSLSKGLEHPTLAPRATGFDKLGMSGSGKRETSKDA